MLLRRVKFSDWRLLLEWRNDLVTRQNSITTDEVQEEPHKKWLEASLDNPNRELYILEDDSVAVGTIRSDKTEEGSFILSWNIAPEARGKGYGVKILEIFLKGRVGKFLAEIKKENVPSIKMAEKNGFKLIEDSNVLLYCKEKMTMTDLEIIDEIEKVRSKNNVNWMDILRVAFIHAPEEARAIMAKINKDDNKISELLEQLSNNK
jgi:RimJ/RimL family protein N-acetyltransferase